MLLYGHDEIDRMRPPQLQALYHINARRNSLAQIIYDDHELRFAYLVSHHLL